MNADTKSSDPMTFKHVKFISVMMSCVGAWPRDAVAGRRRRAPLFAYYLILETVVHAIGQFLFIITWFKDVSFLTLGNVFITLTLSFLVIFRAALPCLKKYGDIFHEFLTKFHLSHFRHKNEHAEQIFLKVDYVSSYFTLFVAVLSSLGVITFNLGPLYTNYRSGLFRDEPPENITLEFSIHYLFPGFRQDDYILLSALLNVWFSFVCAFLLTFMDLFLCLIAFQIIGHMLYLRSMLKGFPKPKELKYPCGQSNHGVTSEVRMVETVQHFDDQENEAIEKKIIECVEHHLLIVKFTADISNFFGPMLAFNYMYHLLTLSILFVECLQGGDAYIHYGTLTMMTLAQLSQLSIIFEILHTESEKVKDAVYYVPWESMSVSNQKSVCLLLNRVQTPITVTAMGMTPVGVKTMGSILKTTLSYCAFLLSLNP